MNSTKRVRPGRSVLAGEVCGHMAGVSVVSFILCGRSRGQSKYARASR
ncbi:MAG: hypothetical protein M0023_13045 [Desulfobacteraceae bacterium]|nr:hypothetical protein [Desulfobacteraceae bacterium]